MADLEPIVGRYLHLTLGDRPHRVYFEEAGSGIPLLCLHTAGADGRQFRHLMNDGAVTAHFRVLAFAAALGLFAPDAPSPPVVLLDRGQDRP